MSETVASLRFTDNHEWVLPNDDGTITVGISDHAQAQLGDLVFVEHPEVGSSYAAHEACAVVESVKAASDIFTPVAGEITAINNALEDNPELVNEDCYGEGWIFRMQPEDTDAVNTLMDSAAYEALASD